MGNRKSQFNISHQMKYLFYRLFKKFFLFAYNYKNSFLKEISVNEFIRNYEQYHHLKYAGYIKKYDLHSTFKFNGVYIMLYGDGRIIAGENSYIGNFSTIYAHPENKVVIGKGCHISHNVRMYTLTNIADQDFSADIKQTKSGDIIIGDYTWIGANVYINPGVKIGTNAIVGANSVVTKDIPDFSIFGGVPARFIRMKNQHIAS
jgi:maltose O-acetyltransferase